MLSPYPDRPRAHDGDTGAQSVSSRGWPWLTGSCSLMKCQCWQESGKGRLRSSDHWSLGTTRWNVEDTGVGKSSIVCRFVQDHFDHNISPTIGASFMTKTVPCGNELHKFLIWDTAGQERFHSLAPMYYRGSAAAVIVYDITKQDSFHTLKKWVKELKEHGPENIVMAIAGNKCDLSDIREVPLKDAKEYAESIGAIVVETSAKNAINIEELFQGISRQIPPLDPHENGNNGAIKLGKQTTQASRRCC
ncbi:ras-related protein Rab-31 isoform X1 [Rhinolophus ferrumequinum]|uniref:RAB31, member RAS onco family n=1 Tax=Rhinolophus ferrumequinum TaxID=59479 RepID=A0A671FHR1_RHIFE|nr:ras-related protein Rab-31 isoform X1 [Rhinolophus ferrumequinum]